ncbi:MAG: AMP-dependent synthetase/ligase, partial [Propionibacteriaceae bacterium]
MTTMHLTQRFIDVAQRYPDRIATRVEAKNGWKTMTYRELFTIGRNAASRLIDHGVAHGDRVAIWASNSPEWTQADIACLIAGAPSVPLYHMSTTDQVQEIFIDAGVKIAIVGSQREYDEVAKIASSVPSLERIIAFDTVVAGAVPVEQWSDYCAKSENSGEVNRRLVDADPEDVATIIYTSGTTGTPKGVVLQHKAFCTEIDALDALLTIGPEDHSLCFLPLSHALERGWTYVVLSHGCMNTYCMNPRDIADMLVKVQPTLFACVPRLYEKVFQTAKAKAAADHNKARILKWSLKVGTACQNAYVRGKKPSLLRQAQLPLADILVLRSIRRAIGGRKSVIAAGGAPLRKEILEFFSAAGILILEGYGMTEAAPLMSFNEPDAFRFGTVGRAMPGGEFAIAPDGEILYRGGNVMQGYWNNPEGTAETLIDGWLHTGDIGTLDKDGFLTITDRKKDLLVTSGGKNIAPQPIEGMIMADPLFENVVAIGDNRPFVTLLVDPSMDNLEA